jgi:hypothetical protein
MPRLVGVNSLGYIAYSTPVPLTASITAPSIIGGTTGWGE